MAIKNSRGKVYYGLHFYPGVAEYHEPNQKPFRVFLNETTLRAMDPTFAGCPIYVEHVDEVEDDIDELRGDADGWVIESFFNAADGKHWVKFLVCSKRAEIAIRNGFRLSNAYFPLAYGKGGLWNGVQYAREVTGAKYEHLAIVRNPRYEESEILTPEKFKAYNEGLLSELKRLSNSKDKKGASKMALKLFKKTKVENSASVEGMSVVLPKSGKEVSIAKLVADADKRMVNSNMGLADPDHKVKLKDGSYCNVSELTERFTAMNSELEELKKDRESVENEEDEDAVENSLDEESEESAEETEEDTDGLDMAGLEEDEAFENSMEIEEDGGDEEAEETEEEPAPKKVAKNSKPAPKAPVKKTVTKNDIAAAKAAKAKKAEAIAKAAALKNARPQRDDQDEVRIETLHNAVERGRFRYGSRS